MMKITALLVGVLSFLPAFQGLTEILPADRRIEWERAGVIAPDGTRGIPIRPPCDKKITTSADIESAVTTCPADTAVIIPAGTFTLPGLIIDRPLVLRGAGADLTTLTLTGGILFSPARGSYAGPTREVNWTGGYNKGETRIVLSDVSKLKQHQTIVLDQLNDPEVVSIPGNAGIQNTYSRNGLNFEGGTTRAQPQLVWVTAIDPNTKTVTIDPPLYYTHKASLAPQAFFWDSGNMNYAGIEDMKVDGAQVDGRAITFNYCSNCWVKGVEVTNPARAAVAYVFYCFRPEIRDSYFHDGQPPVGPTRYGVELGTTSAGLIENTIIAKIGGSLVSTNSTSGNVFGYNYAFGNTLQNGAQTAWGFPSISTHIAHTYANLYEANIAANAVLDVVWGSGSHNVFFRNRLLGYEGPIGNLYINHTYAVHIQAWNRYISVIGNVLGHPDWHRYYEITPWKLPSGGHDERQFIYALGEWLYASSTQNADIKVIETLLRWGNYDYANDRAIWNAAEIPTGIAPLDTTLPNSLYLTSKPRWWNDSPWPPIGPAHPTIANQPLVTKLPAEACYQKTVADGNKFNAQKCYPLAKAPKEPLELKAEKR